MSMRIKGYTIIDREKVFINQFVYTKPHTNMTINGDDMKKNLKIRSNHKNKRRNIIKSKDRKDIYENKKAIKEMETPHWS